MNKFRSGILTMVSILGSVMVATPVAVGSETSPVIISTSVDGTLTLTVAMRKNDPSGELIGLMDFGLLTPRGNALVSSSNSTTGTGVVVALITVNSRGVAYTVSQTGTPMSNGTSAFPDGACVLKPDYKADDNAGQSLPAGASLGSPGSWVTTNKILYISGPSGETRTFQTLYTITDNPAYGATNGVPLYQQSGAYKGTVTITATTG